MPLQGISSALNFGKGIGWCEMLLSIYGLSYEEVTPKKWQTIVSPKREPQAVPEDADAKEKRRIKTANKRQAKEDIYNFARKKFPGVQWRSFNKDSNRADALVIALYCKLKETGLL